MPVDIERMTCKIQRKMHKIRGREGKLVSAGDDEQRGATYLRQARNWAEGGMQAARPSKCGILSDRMSEFA